MLLHNHLDMIGRNEPIQRKAKFWQSYVRALKGPKYPLTERTHMFALSREHSIGTDDIRAPDASHYSRYPTSRGIFRPLLDFPTWPHVKSIFDDPIHPSDRIAVPGYRYLPISRETYGLTPRNIYPHHFTSSERYPRLEYYVPWSDWDPVEGRQMAQRHMNPAYRRLGTKPFVKEYTIGPDGSKVPLYTYTGTPIYSRGGITKRPMVDLFEPKNWIPLSRYTRDPWWWQYPQYKPFDAPYVPMKSSPFYLRDSFLSPVKNTYLWRDHPIRPFCTDDISAFDAAYYSRKPTSRSIFRQLLELSSWPHYKSIFDDLLYPSDRLALLGYRYLPISRLTYGLTPRNIYRHHLTSTYRYPRLESWYHDPWYDWDPVEERQMAKRRMKLANRSLSTKPFIKEYTIGPDGAKVPLYTRAGTPIYSRGGITKRPLLDLFDPKDWISLPRYARDPWWWLYPKYKQFDEPYLPVKHSPYYFYEKFLSPLNKTYLWRNLPLRSFSTSRLVY